jgi:diguanylate cyclase (GGDEF)-like protein
VCGHDAGDTVLRELGDYRAKLVRREDLACRYGGEEFKLILPESSLEDTRLKRSVSRRHYVSFYGHRNASLSGNSCATIL